MKKLNKKIAKNGINYIEIHRNKNIVLYRLYNEFTSIGYEVCILSIHPLRIIGNRIIEAREALPPNESGGKKSFTYYKYNDAFNKFNYLVSL